MTEDVNIKPIDVVEEPPVAPAITRPRHDRPIPRVTIHAHVVDAQSAETLEKVAADRRFSKAHVVVYEGGLENALVHYRSAPTPNLLILEDVSDAGVVFRHLAALAEVCDPGTKVVVVGRENDVAFYRDLMRQGVNEYLVGPLSVIQVIEAVSALYIDPSAPPIGRVFAFAAARGGAGSSTIAHNVGWCISEELEEDATIVDFDLPFGTASLDFNQDSLQGIAEALLSPERLDDVMLERLLLKCTDHLSLFTAPGTLDRELDLDPAGCERVVEVVRQSVPRVILDLPHMWAPWSRHLLCTADEIVITATPDLASLRNAKNIIDLARAVRPNDVPPRLVLNQIGVAKRPEIPSKDFAEALGIEPVLVLTFDPQLFGTASNNGQMIAELSPQSRAAVGLRDLAQTLTGREAPAVKTASLRSVLKQLKGKVGRK